jgi:hypothetical protein
MTFKHKPPCNTEYIDAFLVDTATAITTGENAVLYTPFTVSRT